MATEEQRGYQDAIHHVRKVCERRLHHLENELDGAKDEAKQRELHGRMEEVQHLVQTLESLRR